MRGDVRMVQRGEDFGFALEAREPIGIAGERLGQHLDRDLAFQLGVRRAIHLAHPAGADLGGDFVRAEAGAWSYSQWSRGLYGPAGGFWASNQRFGHGSDLPASAARLRPPRKSIPPTPRAPPSGRPCISRQINVKPDCQF